jgi:hypothetical protein
VTFFLWGYVKEVFVPPVPVTLDDLKQRITIATAGVDEDMLTRVWQEFNYHINICCVTKSAHIESVSFCNKLPEFLFKTVHRECRYLNIYNYFIYIK